MATKDFIAAIELSSSKIAGIAGKKNYDGSLQVQAYAQEDAATFIRKGLIYNVRQAVWHAIHVSEDALVLIVENSNTGKVNSEYMEIEGL